MIKKLTNQIVETYHIKFNQRTLYLMFKLAGGVILGIVFFALQPDQTWAKEKKLIAGDLPQFDKKKMEVKSGPILRPGPKGMEQVGNIKGDPLAGEVIFKKYCVFCHGNTGRGDGLAAMTLTPSPANFVERETFKKGDQELFEIVTYGLTKGYQLEMPAWGPILSKQERVSAISFVKQLSEKGQSR